MTSTMKLRFDPSLEYQQEAIAAVTDLFRGMPLANSSLSFATTANALPLMETGVGNVVTLEREQLIRNLYEVQERNRIARTASVGDMRFAIEMETGTGKTYVYLRTIFELHKRYGLKKFVIVVPSIPIREGVLHSISTMREHFQSLYDVRFEYFVYDSTRLTQIRNFATSDMLQIMVINIQSFIRDVDAEDTGRGGGNVIYREYDKLNGMAPIEYIRNVQPIVIVDEPQRVQAEKSQQAIQRLNSAVILEYSATFESPQKVYRLGPIEAYEQKLVKEIEVASVVQDEDANAAYVKFIQADNTKSRTQIEITVGGVTDPKRKKIWIKQGDDLAQKSDRRLEYQYGYRVESLDWTPGRERIEFSGGHVVTPDAALGEMTDSVMKAQIEIAVRKHFDRELELHAQGIKVLSLFFIDRVANYRDYDANGNPRPGKIARWFEEIYTGLRTKYSRYAALDHPPVAELHDGYFSVDARKKVKDTRGNTKDDESTYELIMRDKERLLSLDEPLRFIFSHSALREGWDNPNVFQICTLNETRSTDKKRQEIGRGLRLPVNQRGERIFDPNINRLTVVANESYREFAETLQREYEQDAGIMFGKLPRTIFNNVVVPAEKDAMTAAPAEPAKIGESGSNDLWQHLQRNGYINYEGEIQTRYDPNQHYFRQVFAQELPESYRDDVVVDQIMDEINRYVFRDRMVKKARSLVRMRVNDHVLDSDEFLDFWNQVAQRTRYIVDFDTEELIRLVAGRIANGPELRPPKVHVHLADLEQTRAGIREGAARFSSDIEIEAPLVIPDIITLIQSETNLTRKTISRILIESGRAEDIRINPQAFITMATEYIRDELNRTMSQGLKYQKRGDVWQARMFRSEQDTRLEQIDNDRLFTVESTDNRSVFDRVPTDSNVEMTFVKRLDTDQRVKYYVKLPTWFKVETPIGSYNPDWAIMLKDLRTFYLVAETKSTTDEERRRGIENIKIQAARAHFDAIGVPYEDMVSFEQVIQKMQDASIAP